MTKGVETTFSAVSGSAFTILANHASKVTKAVSCRGSNMTTAQYFRVTVEILHRTPCRLLLFGAGNDTELHVLANAGGRTLVLEHNPEWLQRIEHLACQRLRVGYSTQIRTGLIDPCPLPDGDLEPVLREHWDVILVDGPEGYRDHHPGRQQSIFLASRLARPGTTIFVHDAERTVESLCAARYLNPANERLGTDRQLAVFGC